MSRWYPVTLLALALFGCNGEGNSRTNLPAIDAGGGPDVERSDSGVAETFNPSSATVVVSANAPEAVQISAADAVDYLTQMGLTADRSESLSACEPERLQVVLVGDGIAGPSPTGGSDQTWGIAEERCGSGGTVTLYGGGLLGRQYAVYDWLHRLGVRFFHPEDEFVPVAPRWTEEVLAVEHTPDFTYRSVSLHLTHPLELGDVFRRKVEAYKQDAVNYVDWQIKNYASYGTSGIPVDGLRRYGAMRGLPRSVGFDLHNQQQDSEGLIDPDSPLTVEEQIANAIDERMGDDPTDYPEQFHFTFNPSEFTELPDEEIVAELTFIANYMAENYPDTILMTTNHGTAGPPTENYGVRFYDLPQFAPENLGVKVHTLMFYDLERPAPVYGNENFHNLFDFMEQEHTKRRIWYYPEAAWWLTFDIPVPLYLPITIEARDRDIQNIAFMLDGKLDGHRAFGSGHEWGYWQNEYCSLRMSADVDYRWTDCIADITAPMGDDAETVATAIEEIVALQETHMFDRELLRWIVGTDAETELAAQIGIEFHPLPPSPEQIMRWSAEEIEAFENETVPQLQAIVDAYVPIVATLRDAEDRVSDASFGYVHEIADGAEANMLRVKHNIEAYSAVVAMRKSRLGIGAEQEAEALRLLDQAEDTTADVARITRSRSDYYRYKPRTRAIAGGEEGNQDDNWTGYNYRYLNRAHHVFYYRRTDTRAREAVEGLGDPFAVPNTLLAPGEMLTITMLDDAIVDVSIDLGDQNSSTSRMITHQYAAPGLYPIAMTGVLEGNAWTADFDVAQVTERLFTGRTGVLSQPETALAAQIEAVLPALAVGPLDDGRLAVGWAPSDFPEVPVGGVAAVPLASDTDGFASEPTDVSVPLSVGGQSSLALTVRDAVFRRLAADAPSIFVEGDLTTQAVIDAVVGLSGGAFDEDSARSVVADALGYTTDTLPETVPFTVEFTIEPTD